MVRALKGKTEIIVVSLATLFMFQLLYIVLILWQQRGKKEPKVIIVLVHTNAAGKNAVRIKTPVGVVEMFAVVLVKVHVRDQGFARHYLSATQA